GAAPGGGVSPRQRPEVIPSPGGGRGVTRQSPCPPLPAERPAGRPRWRTALWKSFDPPFPLTSRARGFLFTGKTENTPSLPAGYGRLFFGVEKRATRPLRGREGLHPYT